MFLWLKYITSIRVTELTLLEIGDVLSLGGAIKLEVCWRTDVIKGCCS